MIFFLSNLYFIGCSYTNGFENAFDQCGSSSKKWPYFFLLAALPLLIRVVQSLKRYSESRMVSHLINVSFPLYLYHYAQTEAHSYFSTYSRAGNMDQAPSATFTTICGSIVVSGDHLSTSHCKRKSEQVIIWCYGVSFLRSIQCMDLHG